MTITHIPYETAKRIKAFLGDSAPEPIDPEWYSPEGMLYATVAPRTDKEFPAYKLHDLLSRPFCEAMEKAYCEETGISFDPLQFAHEITNRYFKGGLPAVCEELERMMEGK